jgi:protein-S-isoprenylcysteine O-methyltransferase Ste14
METIFVLFLFIGYMAIWSVKRRLQKKATGIDPEVIGSSNSPVQQFFNVSTKVLTVYIILLIVMHALGIQYFSMFSRFSPLERPVIDVLGFILGITGLSFCCYAQIVMGNSWRVGIDVNGHTDLITSGLYRYIRNPTYLGLFILCIGVWVIWPTWSIALFGLIFYVLLEFQVRCEEEFLAKIHNEQYQEFFKRTKRYIPKIY